MKSKILKESVEELKSAIETGIAAPAVKSTLNDIVLKSDTTNKTPTQLKETVESIVEMKRDVNTKMESNSYVSKLVSKNKSKIEKALNEGIKPSEVSTTLINNIDNPKKGKKHLKFMVKLISKMKKKELKLNMNKENSLEKYYQKIKK